MTQVLDQATWDAEIERIRNEYQCLYERSLAQSKQTFMDAYDNAIAQLAMISIGVFVVLLLLMFYAMAQHSASCNPESLALPV